MALGGAAVALGSSVVAVALGTTGLGVTLGTSVSVGVVVELGVWVGVTDAGRPAVPAAPPAATVLVGGVLLDASVGSASATCVGGAFSAICSIWLCTSVIAGGGIGALATASSITASDSLAA